MKITIITLFVCLAYTMSAQVSLSSNSFRTKFDSSFAPLLLRTIPHGVLYDRVVPWAALDGQSSGDTVTTDLLAQAWYELDLSRTANPVGHINSKTLRDSILSHKIKNRFFPISINARITILDTLAATDGRLVSKASGYDIDTTKGHAVYFKNALMSALSQQEFVTNTAYAFSVSDKYIYTNDRIGISSIQLIESVNGINITKSPGSSGSITFSYEGKFDIQVKTTYTDHSTVINTQTIEVRNPPPDDP
jgi:hypothetical protein